MLFRPAIRSLTVLAPAKLNLFLRVLRRREDGFHDLETVMTAIDLFDTLHFAPVETSEITLNVVMAGPRNQNTPVADAIPTGPENLVLRAATLLKEYAGVNQGVDITLTKRIPSAAGLGGGSSDAAGTLAGLNRFWKTDLSLTELLGLAARLGSDIGFFLGESSTAVCRGRGELVEPLQVPTCLHFVVARPATGLSTPRVFQHCRPGVSEANVDAFVSALRNPSQSRMVRLLLNDLQTPAELLNDEVRELRHHFSQLPVIGHQMSGSGTSYFGICTSSKHASTIASRLCAVGVPWVRVARSCS